jgi:hypothetical protein
MASFTMLPVELQTHILDLALQLDISEIPAGRRYTRSIEINAMHCMDSFGKVVKNIILACPLTSGAILHICQRHVLRKRSSQAALMRTRNTDAWDHGTFGISLVHLRICWRLATLMEKINKFVEKLRHEDNTDRS